MKTTSARKRLIVANWKMNPSTLPSARRLFENVKKEASRRLRVETIIAAPFVYLPELKKLKGAARLALGDVPTL